MAIPGELDLIALELEGPPERIPNGPLVVHDQDLHLRHCGAAEGYTEAPATAAADARGIAWAAAHRRSGREADVTYERLAVPSKSPLRGV